MVSGLEGEYPEAGDEIHGNEDCAEDGEAGEGFVCVVICFCHFDGYLGEVI